MRTLTSKNEEKIFKQFPFMVSVFEREAGPLVDKKYYKQQFQVSVADGATLYTVPRFCLEPHWVGDGTDKYVGRYEPVAYVINHENKVTKRFQWGYENKDTFIKQLVNGNEDVKIVVLLVKYHWWFHDKDWMKKGIDSYAGEFSHHEYFYYIFKEPKQGFQTLIKESDITKNVRITDILALNMVGYRNNNEATRAMAEIDKIIKNFVNTISEALWVELNKSEERGLSGQFGKTKLMAYSIAGRIMISFWSEKDQITVVGDDSDYKRTGLQSMNCSVDQARSIVQDVVDNWKPGLMKTDNKVFFG